MSTLPGSLVAQARPFLQHLRLKLSALAQERNGWLLTWLLTLLALLPRLYVAVAWAREPVWDGHYYHFGAQRLADGLGYSEDVLIGGVSVWKPWCHYPVGYSGWLSLWYRIFGSSIAVAPAVNAVVGALTVLALHRLALGALRGWRAHLAGFAAAVHPGMIVYSAVVMTEGLAACSLVLIGWAACAGGPRARTAVLTGVLIGLGALVRPTALLTVGVLPFVWWQGGHGARLFQRARRPFLHAGLAAVVALGTLSPWTLRNCRVMDQCTLISSNGGWNLAIGALTETGRFTTLKASHGCPGPGQVKQDKCWGRIGRQTIAAAPLRWLALIPQKLAHTYNHESFAVGYLAEANPALWSDAGKNDLRSGLTLLHHLLMLGAACSVVGRPRLRPPLPVGAGVQLGLLLVMATFIGWALEQGKPPLFWLIVVCPLVPMLGLPGRPALSSGKLYALGLVLTTTLTHAIFFGDDRYHMTLSPLLCLLAAAALQRGQTNGSPQRGPSQSPAGTAPKGQMETQ